MGRECSVLGCTPMEEDKRALFKVPKVGTAIGSWIKFLNVVNPGWKLHIETVTNANLHVCVYHFQQCDVIFGPTGKPAVVKNGFPSVLNGKAVAEMEEDKRLQREPLGKVEPLPSNEQIIDSLKRQLEKKDATITELKIKIMDLQRKLKTANQKSDRHEAQKRKLAQDEENAAKKLRFDILEHLDSILARIDSPFLREVVRRSLIGKNTVAYDNELRNSCFRLHYYSGKGYEVLRNLLGNCIPSTRSLRTWTEHIQVKPGFIEESLLFLKETNANSPTPLRYALMLDEIHIRQQCIHKGDGMIGLVDYGGIMDVEPHKKDKLASASLFVYITAINSTHKLPVCFILTSGVSVLLIKAIIEKSLKRLLESSCHVVAVTFDGLNANLGAAKSLGAVLDVTNDQFKSYFTDPASGRDICVIPDPCHMMKLFRNLLKSYGKLIDPFGQEINWIHVHNLHRLQQKEGLKAANKLSIRHINFELQKMKTRFCLQVMSNSVAVALSVCSKLGIAGFDRTEGTVQFLHSMNNLFDILNSKPGGDAFYKSPANTKKLPELIAFLAYMKFYLLNLKVNECGKVILLIDSKKRCAPRGLVIAIASIEKLMLDYLGKDDNLKYLSFYRFSQDHLEMLFGTIRARQGHNNNPNAQQLLQTVKSILCMKTKDPVNGNCTVLDSDYSARICAFRSMQALMDNSGDVNVHDVEETDEKDLEVILKDLSPFQGNVVAYVSGYVARNLTRKLTCSHCVSNLLPYENELEGMQEDLELIKQRDKGGLIFPSLLLLGVCKLTEQLCHHQKSTVGLRSLSKEDVVATAKIRSMQSFLPLWRRCSTGNECSHFEEFVGLISSEYTKLRYHHLAKEATLQENPTTKRNICTRTYVQNGT